jgi:hypothetical protein
MRGRYAVASAMVLAMTACDPRPAEPAAGNAGGAANVVGPAPVPTPDAAGRPLFNLAPNGVQLVDATTGAARMIPFGTAREQVVSAVQRALGPASGGGPCPVAPLDSARFNGVDLYFRRDGLAGWSANRDGGDAALATAAGIGIGKTLADLESAYAIEVAESSLGIEFTAGDMAGLLSSDAPTATITHLWAGEACIAR